MRVNHTGQPKASAGRVVKDIRDWRSFLALLHDERFLGVRELRCFHAKPPRPAKENYGKKL
jgi:hypothetical protein